jgi:transcription elongation factor GreB
MSKAFLRESDFDDAPDLPPPVSSLPPGAKNYLTTAGAGRLREELARLVEQERPPLAVRAHDPEAKPELRALDQRIRYLQESLRTGEVVAPAGGDDGIVRFGSTVTVRDQAGEESHYQLVGVDETDPSGGRMSWTSPLARALQHARRGERVVFQSPAGARELEIVAVEND